jgi:hypothetical protein
VHGFLARLFGLLAWFYWSAGPIFDLALKEYHGVGEALDLLVGWHLWAR